MVRFRWLVLAGAAAVLGLGVAWGGGVFGDLISGGFDDPGSESSRAHAAITERLGRQDVDVIALYSSPDVPDSIKSRLAGRPEVMTVLNGPPSRDGNSAYLAIQLRDGESDAKLADLAAIEPLLHADPPVETRIGGLIPFLDDASDQISADITKAELISLPILLVLLFFIFRGLVAALTPLMVGILGVLGAFVAVRLLAQVTDVSVFAINIITMLGLGMAIDYSLFIVSRFREELGGGMSTSDAVSRTLATAGRTVMVSGLTVTVALASLLVFPMAFLKSMAWGGMAAVLVAMLAALTALPALLAVLGPRVNSLRIPRLRRSAPLPPPLGSAPLPPPPLGSAPLPLGSAPLPPPPLGSAPPPLGSAPLGSAPLRPAHSRSGNLPGNPAPDGAPHAELPGKLPDLGRGGSGGGSGGGGGGGDGGGSGGGGGGWARLARSVMRRPVIYLVGVSAVLVALALPFLRLQLGGFDERVLPEGTESRVVSERMVSEFPGGGDYPITVFVEGPVGDLPQRIAGLDYATGAHVTAQRGDASLISVTFAGEPTSEDARELVREIRSLDHPGTVVGGRSAADVDQLEAFGQRLPWMLLLIAVSTFVLLFLAFGSVVLPLKAIVMNVISIGASFGVVVWVFQDGHLADLLGVTVTGFLEPSNLVLMLAILFGLATDYEVFLLSRVREEWEAGHDNTSAVALGLQRTGGIITAAALLLIIVVAGFATGGTATIKMLGVGTVVAIAVDAALVRALLVPATMRLLGRWNWWAPGPLARLYARYGIKES